MTLLTFDEREKHIYKELLDMSMKQLVELGSVASNIPDIQLARMVDDEIKTRNNEP